MPSNRVFFEAAKRFQLRALHSDTSSEPLASIRTRWAMTDVDTLAPLVTNSSSAAANGDSDSATFNYETVFTAWRAMAHVLAVHDADERIALSAPSGGASAPRGFRHVAAAYLALHCSIQSSLEAVMLAAGAFRRAAEQGGAPPSEDEFVAAADTCLTLAFSGFTREASFLLEHMLVGVDAIQAESGGGGDDDGYCAEERAVMDQVAFWLRCPFTESVETHARWKADASRKLGNLRSLVAAPAGTAGVAQVRRVALALLFTATGDGRATMEALARMQNLNLATAGPSFRALWFAAAMCALANPFALRKDIVQFLRSAPPPPASESAAAGADGWYDVAIVNGLTAGDAAQRIAAVETIIASAAASPRFDEFGQLLIYMMAAHLADLCCDLGSEKDLAAFLLRNKAVARYAEKLVDYDSQTLCGGVAMAYLLASPLMDPRFAASLLFRVADDEGACGGGGDEERAVRIFEERMAAGTALQKTLRALWRRAAPTVDWGAITGTTDEVWEGALRDLCAERALRLWDGGNTTAAATTGSGSDGAAAASSAVVAAAGGPVSHPAPVACGRCVDAVSLLVRSGNCAAAETLLREALRCFCLSQPATVQRVLLLGEAAAVGTLQDPVLAAQAQLSRSSSVASGKVLLLQTGGHGLTALTLCRRIAELFVARAAVNVLDHLMPLIEDPDFVGAAPAGVLQFAVALAAANAGGIRSLRQQASISVFLNQLADSRKAACCKLGGAEQEALSIALVQQMQRLPLDSM